MKRLYLTVVALLSMTMTFAGNGESAGSGNTETAKSAEVAEVKTDTASYDINYNLRRMGETLGLTLTHMNSVDALNRSFNSELRTVSGASESERKVLLDKAVAADYKRMSYVLTPAQLSKYETLINVTLANRGLEK